MFKQGSKAPAILIAGFAAFGGLLFGYDTGNISGIIAMPFWLETFGTQQADGTYILPSNNKSLIVSILSAGTFFGALLGYPFGDFLGRRWGLIAACLVFSVGVAFQTAATAIPLFVVGRVVAGLGVGLVSCLVPLYQSECAPKWIRGAIVSGYQWFITIGLLLAAIVDYGTKDMNSEACYRIPIGLQFIWAAVLAGGMLILPESPRYLIKKGRNEAAYKSLARLNSTTVDDPQIDLDIKEIIANLDLELQHAKTSYLDCFKFGEGKNFQRTMTGIFLQAWQQLTGINFVFYFGTSYFTSAGIDNPFLITIATNVVNVGMTLPGMYFMDKAGRRKVLIFGAAGMFICELIIAITGTIVGSGNQAAQKVLIAFTCIYIAHFAATWGPAAWVVTGEMYPLATRAKQISMSTASNWLWNFGIGYATPYLVDEGPGNAALGSKVFFIWSATCFGSMLFAYFFIWETKGLSLEQVDYLIRSTKPPRSSSLNAELRRNSAMDDAAQGQMYSNKAHDAGVEVPSLDAKVANEGISEKDVLDMRHA